MKNKKESGFSFEVRKCAFCRREYPLTEFQYLEISWSMDTCRPCCEISDKLANLVKAKDNGKIDAHDFKVEQRYLLAKVGIVR